MRPTDLQLLTQLSRPTMHPSGDRVVVAASHPDLDSDLTVGQLWAVPISGGEPTRLTLGVRDSAPAFSPDGSMLAFLRAAKGSPAQVHVMPATGGEPVAITDRPLGVSEFEWSPDSTMIAFIARVPEHGRYGTIEGLEPDAEPARRITTLKYKANGTGYVLDRPAHAFIVEVPALGSEPRYAPAPGSESAPAVLPARQLTHSAVDHRTPRFTPDGRLAVIAPLHATRDTDLKNCIYSFDLDGSNDARPLIRSNQQFSLGDAIFLADGSLVVSAQDLGPDGTDFIGRNAGLFLVAKGTLERLTDAESIDLGEPGSHLTVVEGGVLAHNRTRGGVRLIRVSLDGSIETLTPADSTVVGHASGGGRTVVSIATPMSAGDLAVVEVGTLRMLSDFSASLRDTGIAAPIELEVASADGYPIHGWLVRPAGEGPHPVLLAIHGGPFAQYGAALFDEAQVYASAGYAVLMCNPRGSAGYGERHGQAITERMGTDDLVDVLHFLDGAIAAHPELDGDRVGIMGGSYGGYLTAWTIAHDDRFVAAIVERGFLDPESFIGTSDIGSYFGQAYVGTDPDRIAAQSPQAVAHRVTTPTLVIHSEQDLRCPLGQAERYFATLLAQGTPAELLIFPGENHELSRSGRPRHRLERFEAILEWWGHFLPVGEPE